MRGNGKVFISHSHADNALCEPLLKTLWEWGIDYWFDTERIEAGQVLSDRIQAAIAERDIFIRICTASVLRNPYWVNEETSAFRALQAEDERAGRNGKRILLSIVMDTFYVLQPFEKARLYIDAARLPDNVWRQSLRKVLLPGNEVLPNHLTLSNPLVVDWQQTGDHTRISRAIDAAENGQVIVVKPGEYHDALVINKDVEIRGEGRAGEVVVIAEGSDVVLFAANRGKLTNLTLRQSGGRGRWYGVDVAHGEIEIVDCDITSKSLACVAVHGNSRPIISRCKIHTGAQSGVLFYDGATGLIETSDIYGNALHGIAVKGRSQPTVRGNSVSDNKEDGIYIFDEAGGLYESNRIANNRLSGVVVAGGGRPIFRHNTVQDNEHFGLRIHDRGGGVFEENTFRQNKGGAKTISPESKASVTYTNNRE